MRTNNKGDRYLTFLMFGIVALVEIIWIINSDGFYFIDDSCHFNYNRHFTVSYEESIGSWHRIGRVWLFALPAQFGLKGVQLASALLFLLTIYIAYRILVIKNIEHAFWVIPLIGFQPVLFNISFTSLAEVPAVLIILMSYYFYLKDRFIPVMLLSSLAFIFRSELYFVSGIFLLIYLFRRKWAALPLFFAGPFIWFIYSWAISREYWRFIYDMGLHSRLPRISEGIDWYYYLVNSPKIFGFIQVIFFIAGFVLITRKKRLSEYWILLVTVAGILIIQTLAALKGLDLTCSIGQLRYVSLAGPMLAIIAAAGLSSFYEKLGSPYIRNTALIFLTLFMFFLGPYATPFHKKLEIERVSERIVETAKNSYPDYTVISNLHYIANAMDAPASGGDNFRTMTGWNIETAPKALIIWSRELESSPFVEEKALLSELQSNPRIELISTYSDTVNHNFDIPMYRHYPDEPDKKFARDFIEYMIKDQYTWESFEVRVFRKQ